MHRSIPPLASRSAAAALALALLASGCAGPQKKPEFVVPQPPEIGRIRWVRSFRSEQGLNDSFWYKFFSAILPRDDSSLVVAPTGLALSPDEKKLYAAMPHRKRVLVVDLVKLKMYAIGLAGAGLHRPIGVAVDAEGLVYVSDKDANDVVVYSPDGKLVRQFGKETLSEPTGLAIDRKRQIVYVVNEGSTGEGRHSVEAFSLTGKHLRTFGGYRSAEPGYFNFPRGVGVSHAGELFVADMLNFRIQVFDSNGQLLRTFGEAGNGVVGKFDKIQSMGFDTFDNVYIADILQGIHVLNDEAFPLILFGPPIVQAPTAVVVDSRNHIYVADQRHALHEFELINTKTAADCHPKRGKGEAKPASAPPPPQPSAAPTPASDTTPAPAPIDSGTP